MGAENILDLEDPRAVVDVMLGAIAIRSGGALCLHAMTTEKLTWWLIGKVPGPWRRIWPTWWVADRLQNGRELFHEFSPAPSLEREHRCALSIPTSSGMPAKYAEAGAVDAEPLHQVQQALAQRLVLHEHHAVATIVDSSPIVNQPGVTEHPRSV